MDVLENTPLLVGAKFKIVQPPSLLTYPESKNAAPPQQTNLFNRLDKLKWSSWHRRVSLLLGTGWAMDAFETSIVTASIANIASTFDITDITEKALITSVWTIGGLVGALLFGYVSDRFGRKLTFLLTLVMYSFFTCITALSPNFSFFLFFRAATSIGVAAEYSAVTSSLAEFLPSKERGAVSTLVLGMWTIGALAASLVNLLLIPSLPLDIGWRFAFASGAGAAFFALWARRHIPESPRWLLSQGMVKEAEDVVHFIECEANQPNNQDDASFDPFDLHENEDIITHIFSLIKLFPFQTSFASVLNLSQAFGGYGVQSLLALAILPAVDIPTEKFPLFYFCGSIFTLPGTLTTAFLMQKVRRKILLPLVYFLAAFTTILLYLASHSGNATSVWAAFCFYSFGNTLAWNTSYPMYAELFPTRFRSTGIGFAVFIGRLGGFAGPLILNGVYYGFGGPLGAFIVVTSFFLVSCIASIPFALYGVEAKDKSLEKCTR